MKYLLSALLALGISAPLLTPAPAFAEEPPVYTSWRNNLAISGYDSVSYHSGLPLKGKPEFSTEHDGAIWLFSTEANRDLFLASPDTFTPQYGGYCAWAIAHGKLAKSDPLEWHIEDGKLYLNFNARIKRRWDKKRETFITQADARWPDILSD